MSAASTARKLLELLRDFSCYEPQVFDPQNEDGVMNVIDFMDYLDAYVGAESQTKPLPNGHYEEVDDDSVSGDDSEEDTY